MSGRLMSQKYPGAAANYEPAMSFEEIGAAIGVPKQTAYFIFVKALNKLRRRAEMRRLRELAELKDSLRKLRPEDLA